MTLNVHYEKVLRDLEERRGSLHRESARIRKELEELDRLMDAIRRVAPEEAIEQQQSLDLRGGDATQALPDLSEMSMRWGILSLLVDCFDSPLSSSEIADLLQRARLPDPNGKLRKNVSAVLSRMVGLQEVANDGSRYSATRFGRDMWASIKKSPKFLTLRTTSAPDIEPVDS